MKRQLLSTALLMALLLLVALPARAQSAISFEFANVQTSASGLSFDVVATAAAGAKLGDSQVYLDYSDAFGTLVNENGRLSASLGAALAGSGKYYENVLVNDNDAQRVSLVAEYVGEPGEGLSFAEGGLTLFHVTLDAVGGVADASVSFDEGLMEGQQFSDDFATTLGDVLAVDLLDVSLPLALAPLVQAAPVGDGSVKLTWPLEGAQARFRVEHADGFASVFSEVGHLSAEAAKSNQMEYVVEGLPFGTHRFRVGHETAQGQVLYSAEVEVEVEMAERFILEPAYPNPFNPQATIRFAVKEAEHVRAELYNALGQRVKALYDGTPAANTFHQVQIDGSDLASGLYLVRVQGASFVTTQQVMLLK